MSSDKIDRWFKKNLVDNLDVLIVDGIDGGGWLAFGSYQILPNEQGFSVLYYNSPQGDFSSKRTAISYCVADRLNQQRLAREIQILDQKKQQLDTDVGFARLQAQAAKDPNTREMLLTKIQTKETTRRVVTAELEKCVNSAKYLQLRGFSK